MFLFRLPRRFWRFAPLLFWFLPPIWVGHLQKGPQAPAACYLLSVWTGPTVGMSEESVNSHSMPTQTAMLISVALFSAALGRAVPLSRRAELAACFPANPFPLSAWIFCLFAVMEQLNGQELKVFCFLWASFLPKINHHVGVTVTGNIGSVFCKFNFTCVQVCWLFQKHSRSTPPQLAKSRRHVMASRSRFPGRHCEEMVKAAEIFFICLSGAALQSSGALLEGRPYLRVRSWGRCSDASILGRFVEKPSPEIREQSSLWTSTK